MHSSSVKVDVGIPAYGRPHLLVQAIESALGQTLTEIRITISDNGPGGGEVEQAVQPYLSDERVRYVSTGGVPQHENMTRLIQTGDAPYVGLLHDDDIWEPEFLERRVDFLEAHPDCGFAFSSKYVINSEGQRIAADPRPMPEGVIPSEVFLPILYERNPVSPPSLLVRRSAYEAVGPSFTPELRRYFDYEMLFRLAARFPVGYLPVADCGYRLHTGSTTSASRHFGEEHLHSLDVAEAIVSDARPGFRFDPELRARIRSFYELRACMDLLEQGRRRTALGHLQNAVRLRPQVLGNFRFAAGLFALLLGPLGQRALQAARDRQDARMFKRRTASAV